VADFVVRALHRYDPRQEGPDLRTEMLGLHYRDMSDEIWGAVHQETRRAAHGQSEGTAAP
jgi:hypothetical protein